MLPLFVSGDTSVVVSRHLHIELVVRANELVLRARRLALGQVLTMRRGAVAALMQRRRINYVLTIDLIETWITTTHA